MRAKRLVFGSITLLAAVPASALSAAGQDTKPPRIVGAVMQDADGDAHADRVQLTYSERIRHADDRDGRYPFRIAGYRIQAVGKANGKTILVRLVEQATADDAARPTVRYARVGVG